LKEFNKAIFSGAKQLRNFADLYIFTATSLVNKVIKAIVFTVLTASR
jgi:hypothetical protein